MYLMLLFLFCITANLHSAETSNTPSTSAESNQIYKSLITKEALNKA